MDRDSEPHTLVSSSQLKDQCVRMILLHYEGHCFETRGPHPIALLKGNPNPSDADIESAMNGNICRCGTYVRIKKAIRMAADQSAT